MHELTNACVCVVFRGFCPCAPGAPARPRARGLTRTRTRMHAGTRAVNSTAYSTTLYTAVAESIIAQHAGAYSGGGSGGGATKPLFLYLPHQAVHVGNVPEPSHPEYALDQVGPHVLI